MYNRGPVLVRGAGFLNRRPMLAVRAGRVRGRHPPAQVSRPPNRNISPMHDKPSGSGPSRCVWNRRVWRYDGMVGRRVPRFAPMRALEPPRVEVWQYGPNVRIPARPAGARPRNSMVRVLAASEKAHACRRELGRFLRPRLRTLRAASAHIAAPLIRQADPRRGRPGPCPSCTPAARLASGRVSPRQSR